MNLNMIRHKVETEDIILSTTKNCETLIKQTHTKAEETLEFRLTRPKKNFIPIHIYLLKDFGRLV